MIEHHHEPGEDWCTSLCRSRPRCRQGHEWNEENTYRRANGKRDCRVCMKLRARQRRRNEATREGLLREVESTK